MGLGAVVAGAALAIVAVTVAQVSRAGRSGADPLGGASAFFGSFVTGCGLLYELVADALPWLRIPAAILLLAVLAAGLVARRPLASGQRLLAALLLGWVAQSFLAEGRWGVGAGLYLAVAVGYGARADPPRPLRSPLPAWIETACYLLLLLLFAGLCAYRLDVFPKLYFDEGAYLMAARMRLGGLEPGLIQVADAPLAPRYRYEQFEAQAIPLWIHATAVERLSPSILSLRLCSLAAAVAALVVACLAIRRRVGPRVALWMLALSVVSPYYLAYARAGFFLAFSTLHAVLSFVATLRLVERWDRSSAIVAGIVLGSAAYLYQASWFVPLLAGAALLAGGGLRPWRSAPGVPLLALAAAGVVLAPAVLGLRPGFDIVLGQTFDERAAWGEGYASAELTRSADDSATSPRAPLLQGFLPFFTFWHEAQDRVVIRLSVPASELEPWVDALEERGWQLRSRGPALPRAVRNLGDMASLLFFAPGYEQAGHWLRSPLLTHLLAPLAVLGLLEALRRRREPVMRVLLVLVVGAALLPGALGQAVPRRAVLLMPLLHALSALPLTAGLQSVRSSVLPVLGTLLLFTAALCAGSHAYFALWYVPAAAEEVGLLEYRKLLRSQPADRPVLTSPSLADLEGRRRRIEGDLGPWDARRVAVSRRIASARDAWRASCETPLPFVWITLDSNDDREFSSRVERSFEVEADVQGSFRVLRVLGRRPHGCPRAAG